MMSLFEVIKRSVSTFRLLSKNYYQVLGVAPKATQRDIKSAYYRLSMIYHPDRNEGCEVASKRFQAIKDAYEVLSDYDKRRLYDKGIVEKGDGPLGNVVNQKTKVYDVGTPPPYVHKRRPNVTTQSASYGYDEWSKAHYGRSFSKIRYHQTGYEEIKRFKEEAKLAGEKSLVIFGLLLVFGLYVYLSTSYENLDTPRTKPDVSVTRKQT